MTTTVLAYFPSPGQGVWYLGPIPIRAYALCIIAGIIAALVIGDRRWAARGGERGVVYDVALWAVPFGLIGGRLYHLLTDWKTYFGPGGAGLGAAVRIWEGGLGIWGAVFLGGVGAWIACRRRGIPLPAFGDAVAPGIVLAQAIGRLGNYFNQELYGRETTVPWGMEIFYRRDSSGMVDVHSLDGVSTGQVAAVVQPTFLYELLWNLLVFFFLLWADRKFRLGHGRLFALYVASYCVGRFWIELMRDDTATHIAGIRINVFTATFVFIGAVVYMLLAPKGRENPASLVGHEPEGLHEERAEERAEERVEEWAEDLVAAATGGGILAAAKVAGEHEDEDAEAAGDVEAEELDVEELDVEELDVDELEAVEDVEAVEDSDREPASADEVNEQADADAEQAELAEDLADEVDEVEAVAEVDEVAEVGEGPESDASETDDSAVVVYEQSAEEPETVVVYESEPAAEPEAEAEAEALAEGEAVADVEDVPEAEAEPEVASDVKPEPEPEPEPEPVAEKPAPEPEPVHDTDTEDEPVKLKGSTLKRLLWGAGRN